MSASLYYRQSEIAASKSLPTSSPQNIMDTLENAFGQREPHLDKTCIPALEGIVAARKACLLDYRPFERLIDGINKYNEVDVFARY